LIVAVMRIPLYSDLTLPETIRLVTANPARAARLEDRGSIEVGKRADLIAVGDPGGVPQVTDAWVHGMPVYRAGYDHG
jgi:alpha-D-ribose 1-methylphosphonate 5-triphosphate diphosphatase